mmetsp:Transcript_73191/g.128990  ORF Transcript_73191/g.128990 Transcript_73191/m.128990 type:complete len:82 (-) Transcript_73191:727-972(-)
MTLLLIPPLRPTPEGKKRYPMTNSQYKVQERMQEMYPYILAKGTASHISLLDFLYSPHLHQSPMLPAVSGVHISSASHCQG